MDYVRMIRCTAVVKEENKPNNDEEHFEIAKMMSFR